MAARICNLKDYSIIILLIFLATFRYAQSADIKFEHLTVQDGLSDNRVLSIIQDSKGFMWFGTSDGLNRYDGYKFKTYRHDPTDSLSLGESKIQVLYEDHLSELWIGTRGGGLCRYDRENDRFIRYNSDKDNPKSLCGDYITSIYQTDNHNLWIGTNFGLNRYNRESNDFRRYYPDDKNLPFDDNINFIGAITQDENGQIWIRSWNQGLFIYDLENDKFVKYKSKQKYIKSYTNQFGEKLSTSHWKGNNYLWFASFRNGLFKINIENGEIRHYKHESDNPNSIGNNIIMIIYRNGNKSNELWFGTEYGLDRFDMQTEKFIHIQHQSENSSSRNYDPVWSIYKDKSGLMWVGTAHGVCKFDPNSAKFKTIQLDTENPGSLSGGFVWTIHESTAQEDGSVVWIGTDNGLFSFNRTSGQFNNYKHDSHIFNSLSHNDVSEIIQSELGGKKVLWVSTLNGLNKIDLKTKQITRYYIPTNDPVYNQIYTHCEDNNGIIWIGTQTSFLYSFDPDKEQFTQHPFKFGIIRELYSASSSVLWIGTEDGLYKFNTVTKEEMHYQHISGDLTSISNNTVGSILEDRNGILWIGTNEGLNKYNRSTQTFTRFYEKDGLISNKIRAILEDGHGNLWISTDKGISKFNPHSKEFRNFTKNDGLHDNEFWWGGHINDRGELYFGGRNGLTYFHPDSIKENNYFPPVVLTDFQIFNTSVIPGRNSALNKQVSEVSEITLSHEKSIFSFEFAALEYRKPEKIRYAYKMEGVDPDWVYTDATRRFVTYTQLDAGQYVFQVKASNSNGVWNEQGTSVRITILPPWWKTWWAYSISIAIILGTVYGLRRYEISRQRLKHQVELEHVEAEKLQELDRMKSRFFANISHEFRTPLTLIKGPIARWLPEIEKQEMKRDFEMTQRNTNRLLRLVNQLLDISRLESGKMKLQTRPENIVELTRQLTMAFESLASVNDIDLRFTSPREPITVYLDREHYEKIITNLLFNAIKFTSEGGKVMVDLSLRRDMAQTISTTDGLVEKQSPIHAKEEIASPASWRIRKDSGNKDFVEIKVTDTGTGIPADQLPHIFDRFYQAGDTYARDSQGSGIGLALTKELVELHHGEIEVTSQVDKGTEFTIRLPLGKEHLKQEEIVDIPLNPLYEVVDPSKGEIEFSPLVREDSFGEGGARRAWDVLADIPAKKPATRTRTSKSAPILLIVEDNPGMRAYIREMLVESYRVVEAVHGQEGFEKAVQIIPDIIISDVMMPEMDGFQFCEKIKTDERTSHIPVILLTAKSSGESKVEGLEFGADDYVTKPFDAKELSVRSKNLLEQRRRLREHFKREIDFTPAEITVNSMDEQFLRKVCDLIEKYIEDPNFNVEKFSKEIGMSRQHLNRKLHALTSHSALDFIRTMRLKKAAQLLQKKSDLVTQIAYQVGFNNPAYFAQCFRREFGMSPSQYSASYT